MAKTLRDDKINRIIFISLGGIIAAIILFLVVFNISNKNSKNDNLQISNNETQEIAVEEANSSIGKNVEESKQENNAKQDDNLQIKVDDKTQSDGKLSEELDNVEEITEETNNNISSNDIQDVANSTIEINSANANNVDNTEKKEEEKDPVFCMPVEGEITKHYGKEKLIYSETLKEWTTHLGIDIKADKTTVVKASADGTVKSIKNDPRYGLTVVIEHQNGFTSVYSNLLTAEFVVQGENVKSGQTLGTVGNSATFEILDDAHLHFEIFKDGNSVDPEMYIK